MQIEFCCRLLFLTVKFALYFVKLTMSNLLALHRTDLRDGS